MYLVLFSIVLYRTIVTVYTDNIFLYNNYLWQMHQIVHLSPVGCFTPARGKTVQKNREVSRVMYLGSQVAADGGCEIDVVYRMNEGNRAWRSPKRVLSNRGLGIKAKKCLHEGVIVPMALHGAEAWCMKSAERRKLNVLEVKCFGSLVGVSRMDRVRNEKVRMRAGIERKLASSSYQRVFR